jgi:hypothetical protein
LSLLCVISICAFDFIIRILFLYKFDFAVFLAVFPTGFGFFASSFFHLAHLLFFGWDNPEKRKAGASTSRRDCPRFY